MGYTCQIKVNGKSHTFDFKKCPRCELRTPKKCVICGHKILSMDDPKKTKQDTLSFQILDKWICGRCGTDIMARWS